MDSALERDERMFQGRNHWRSPPTWMLATRSGTADPLCWLVVDLEGRERP